MNRKRPPHAILFVVAFVAVVGAWLAFHEPATQDEPVSKQAEGAASHPWVERGVAFSASEVPLSPGRGKVAGAALEGTRYEAMRVDPAGRLVLDNAVQENLERLIALNERAALQHKLDELGQGLPVSATRQLQDLLQQYQQYEAALKQAFADGGEALSAQDALRQLDAMHALRVRHFGEEAAHALFSDDEEVAREIIHLSMLQSDPSLGFEQRLELAQEAYSRLDQRRKR